MGPILAVQSSIQFHTPPRNGFRRFLAVRVRRIVRQVIALAHERVNGAHAGTLLAIEQQKGIVEVLRALPRDALAMAIRRLQRAGACQRSSRGRHRNKIPMRSTFEM
jgi:hypothetical protein